MSLQTEAKRVAYGGEIAGLKNTGTSCLERLETLKTQFADLRIRLVDDPDMGQAELDEHDAVAAALIGEVQAFAAQF